jgi:hypothetical protein
MRGGSHATCGFVQRDVGRRRVTYSTRTPRYNCASLHGRNGATRVILDACHVQPYSPKLCGVSPHLHLGVLSSSDRPGTNGFVSFAMGHASCRTARMWFRLSCVELHRGSGPRKSLHGQSILYTAMYLPLRVDDMLESAQVSGQVVTFLVTARVLLMLHIHKQLAALGRGEQDWRRAAFGASLAPQPACLEDGHKV